MFILLSGNTKIRDSVKTSSTNYPEIKELEGNNLSFNDLKKYFTNLAEAKGAPYAYEVLKVAPIPQGIDMHLMGHVVGDILYKQKGAQGIKYCTEDFRNACSHTIVVGLLLEKGEQALKDISEACKQAPGGSGAYTMCYHGLGHGVLSYTNFDLKKAIALCGKVQPSGFSGPEATQCISGTIMEIISGGDHDKKTWESMRKLYLKDSDPLSPCNSDYMPDSARPLCYIYLTPNLFMIAGADMGNPLPEFFKKAFTYCKNATNNLDPCYGGFGKEFVVLAAGRDIRMNNLTNIPKDQFQKVFEWCKLADNINGTKSCLENAVNSYYWGGENKPDISIGFCNSIPEEDFQSDCFKHFITQVNYYNRDQNYRKNVCKLIPKNYQQLCQENS